MTCPCPSRRSMGSFLGRDGLWGRGEVRALAEMKSTAWGGRSPPFSEVAHPVEADRILHRITQDESRDPGRHVRDVPPFGEIDEVMGTVPGNLRCHLFRRENAVLDVIAGQGIQIEQLLQC